MSWHSTTGNYPKPDVKICEEHTRTLRCDEGLVIDIFAADFGRTDGSTCTDVYLVDFDFAAPEMPQADCVSDSSYDTVKELCQGRQECNITASRNFFNDNPCDADIPVYAEVQYACVLPGRLLVATCPEYNNWQYRSIDYIWNTTFLKQDFLMEIWKYRI